ncbi:MAG: hypothetical protein ACP5OO_08205 [Chloroflexia bacterium]
MKWLRKSASLGRPLYSAWVGLGMLLLLFRLAVADRWSAPLNLSQTAGRTSWPVLQEATTSGDLFVAWTDYTADAQGDIWVRRRIGATGVWSTTSNLSDSPQRDEGPALFADVQGRVHLAWTRRETSGGTTLLYRDWEGGGWSAIQVLDRTSTYIPSPYSLSFIQDDAGRLCLFVTLGSGVSRTCLSAGGWEPLSPWVYVPGMRSLGALVWGPDGLLHAAILGENPGDYGCDPWLDDVYYATTADGVNWTVGPNLSAQGSIAYDTALAFDAQGRLHLFWSDISPLCSYDSERSAVYERVLEQGVWGPRREVSVPNEGQAVQDLALARDAAGRLHLAWSEGLFNAQGAAVGLTIHYRRWDGSVWGEEEGVYPSSLRSIRVDLVVGQDGSARAVWEEGEAWQEDVFFSERAVGRWNVFLPFVASSPAGIYLPKK